MTGLYFGPTGQTFSSLSSLSIFVLFPNQNSTKFAIAVKISPKTEAQSIRSGKSPDLEIVKNHIQTSYNGVFQNLLVSEAVAYILVVVALPLLDAYYRFSDIVHVHPMWNDG